MNTSDRTLLPGTHLYFFDARAAVDRIAPGAYNKLPYSSRVLAENLVRRCDPATLTDSLKQLIERKRETTAQIERRGRVVQAEGPA